MIRAYQQTDQAAVVATIQRHTALAPEEIIEQLDAPTALVYDDGAIRGVGVMGGSRVALFVDPSARGRGIGRQLWGALEAALRSGGDRQVFSRFDIASAGFFQRRGFAHVVHLHIMGYAGPAFPEPTLDAQP